MAELGIIASVVQIADVGLRLSIKLYTFGEIVASADRSVISISKDVSLTSGVLKELGQILDKDRETRTFSENAVQTADGVVKECLEVFHEMENILVKKLPSLGGGGKEGPRGGERVKRATIMLERLKWGYLQPKLQLLRSNLDRLKSTLLLMLNVITYARQVSERTESPSVIAEQRSLIEDLAHSNQEYIGMFERLKLGIEEPAVEQVDDAPILGAVERKPYNTPKSLPETIGHKSKKVRYTLGATPLQEKKNIPGFGSEELTTATRSSPNPPSSVTRSLATLPNAYMGNAFTNTSVQTNIVLPPIQERGIPTTEAPMGFDEEVLFKQLEHYSMLIENLLKEVDEAQYKITFKSRLRMKGGIAGLHEGERQEFEKIWGRTALQSAEQRLYSLVDRHGELPRSNTFAARHTGNVPSFDGLRFMNNSPSMAADYRPDGRGQQEVWAEPHRHHLQPALAVAAPPPEPSASGAVGAPASFFSGELGGDESPHATPNGHLFYVNSVTGASTMEDPSRMPIISVNEAAAQESRVIGVSGNHGNYSDIMAEASRQQSYGTVNSAAMNMQMQGGVPPGAPNRALQDYQMQLMLLEQQKKKRLLMARQEQDTIGSDRPDGSMRGSPLRPQSNNSGMQPPPSSHPQFDTGQNYTKEQMVAISETQNGVGMNRIPQQQQAMMQAPQPQQGVQMGMPQQRNEMPPSQAVPNMVASGRVFSPTPQKMSKANPKGRKDLKERKKPAKKNSTASVPPTPASEAEQPPTPVSATLDPPQWSGSLPTIIDVQGQANMVPPMTSAAPSQSAPEQQHSQMFPQQRLPAVSPQLHTAMSKVNDLDGGADESYSMPFNSDLNNSDILENFDFEKYLQTTEGDSKLDPSTFESGGEVEIGSGRNAHTEPLTPHREHSASVSRYGPPSSSAQGSSSYDTHSAYGRASSTSSAQGSYLTDVSSSPYHKSYTPAFSTSGVDSHPIHASSFQTTSLPSTSDAMSGSHTTPIPPTDKNEEKATTMLRHGRGCADTLGGHRARSDDKSHSSAPANSHSPPASSEPPSPPHHPPKPISAPAVANAQSDSTLADTEVVDRLVSLWTTLKPL